MFQHLKMNKIDVTAYLFETKKCYRIFYQSKTVTEYYIRLKLLQNISDYACYRSLYQTKNCYRLIYETNTNYNYCRTKNCYRTYNTNK